MKRFFLFLVALSFASQMGAINEPTHLFKPVTPSKIFLPKRMDALLICDTSDTQTKELHLQDMRNMQQTVTSLASQCSLPLNMKVLTGDKIKASQIKKWIQSIPKCSYGLFFVYYTGPTTNHNKTNKWPLIQVLNKKKKKKLWNIDRLLDQTHRVHPQFSICLLDAYDKVKEPFNNGVDPLDLLEKTGPQKEPLSYLFCRPQGTLIAASSSKGAPSYGLQSKNVKGGAFTLMLLQSLYTSTSMPRLWQGVFKEVETNCHWLSIHQKELSILRSKHAFLSQASAAEFIHMRPPEHPGHIK